MFDTTNDHLANRCIKAQRENKKITEYFETPAGQITITGKVQSVMKDCQSSPTHWTITIIPQ